MFTDTGKKLHVVLLRLLSGTFKNDLTEISYLQNLFFLSLTHLGKSSVERSLWRSKIKHTILSLPKYKSEEEGKEK